MRTMAAGTVPRPAALIFDLDGTLFDGDYDWPAIKRRLGVSRSDGSILDHLASLTPQERASKEKILKIWKK